MSQYCHYIVLFQGKPHYYIVLGNLWQGPSNKYYPNMPKYYGHPNVPKYYAPNVPKYYD